MSTGGVRPSTYDSRSIGNRTQQNVNCDYLHVSRSAIVHNLELQTINSKTIHALVSEVNRETVDVDIQNLRKEFDVDIQNLRKEIEYIRNELREIRRNSGSSGYQAGRAVTVKVHFEDIDVNDVDMRNFEAELLAAFSEASGVNIEHIVLICIKDNNGSICVEIEIQFHFSNDPIIQEKLNNFLHVLSSGQINSLSKFGDTNILFFHVGPIEGVNCKIANINNRFNKSEISFEDSDTLILGDYRLKIKNKQLFIQRYNHDIGEYIGGTVVTD